MPDPSVAASQVGGRAERRTGGTPRPADSRSSIEATIEGLISARTRFRGCGYCRNRRGVPLLASKVALVVSGAGLRLVVPNLSLTIQNAVAPETLWVVTSAVSSFGGALSGYGP